MNIYQFPWETVKLKDLCKVQLGRTPLRREDKYWDGGTNKWLSISDMNQGRYIYGTSEYMTDFAVEDCNVTTIPVGTVLLSFKLSIGKVSINKVPLSTNEAIAALLIKDEARIYRDYLYWVLQVIDLMQNTDSAAKGKTLNKGKIKELDIPLPPLETQKKIAAILDKANALRQKRRQTVEKLDELTQSVFLEMFGDNLYEQPDTKLEGILDIQHGAAFKSSWFDESGGVPVVKIGTVNKSKIDFSDVVFLSESYKQEYSKYLVYPGDLMLSMTGTVGKDDYANPCILTDRYPEYFLNQRVVNIQFDKSKINKSFLLYLFKQKKIKGQLVKLSRGIRQANVSNKDIYEIEINLPPLKLQAKFDKVFRNVSQAIDNCEKSLNHFDNLFNALLQKAFKGELQLNGSSQPALAAEPAQEYEV